MFDQLFLVGGGQNAVSKERSKMNSIKNAFKQAYKIGVSSYGEVQDCSELNEARRMGHARQRELAHKLVEKGLLSIESNGSENLGAWRSCSGYAVTYVASCGFRFEGRYGQLA